MGPYINARNSVILSYETRELLMADAIALGEAAAGARRVPPRVRNARVCRTELSRSQVR